MSEAERVENELSKDQVHSNEFEEQLARLRQFRKMMSEIGLSKKEEFNIPLMHRLGVGAQSRD